MGKNMMNLILSVLVVASMVAMAGARDYGEAEQGYGTAVFSRQGAIDNGGGDTKWSIVAVYDVPENASGLAYDGTYLYCGMYGANGDEVYRINPATGDYVLLFDNGPQGDAFGLTYDGTYLWTTDHPGSSANPAIAMQLDTLGNLISQFSLPDHYMSGIAYDNGDFWVATYYPDPGTIYKVDGSGSVLTQFTPPNNQPWDLCLQNEYLWVADYWGDSLYKIDTITGARVEAYASEGTDPAGIVWDGQYLWYCDNGAGGVDYLYKVDLGGAGTPEIYVPVTEYDFGVVTIGDSASWDAAVENVGDADLEIRDVTFTGSDELFCRVSFPVVIAPGNDSVLPILYKPTSAGPLVATATIESNDPVHPEVGLTLSGNAVNPGPDIHLPEDSHDYGTVRARSYPGWYMEIQNMGDETLFLANISSDDEHFVVDDRILYPLAIDVLDSAQVWIWFYPTAAALYSGTLTISSNDPDEDPCTVSVSGSGFDMDCSMGVKLWEYQISGGYDNSPKAIAPISDMNGDSIAEVIVCSEDDYVRCVNGNSHGTGDVYWEHEIYAGSVYSQSGLVTIEDIDDDGYEDVVVGSAWGGRLIRVISGRTGDTIWNHDTHEYGDGGWVYQVDCSHDYNNDGTRDVLAATGDDGSDTGPKRVYCLNGLSGLSIWECPLGGPGFSVIGIEDCTGDGQPDVLAGASNEAETEGRAFGINGATGDTFWTFVTAGTSVWALAQVDDMTGDGIEDVMIGDFSGNIYGLDATDGSLEYSNSGFGIILRFERIDDVNEDGHPEVVPAHGGSSVNVVDGQTGDIVWSHPVLDKPWNLDRVDDISGDATNDLLIGTLFTNNYCYFMSGADGSELISPINFGTAVDAIGGIPDIVGDGSMEMVAGGRNGYVACFSGGTEVAVLCGDCNDDGRVTIADATYIVGFIYRSGPAPIGEGDVNVDGRITIADATYIVGYVYRGGPPPCQPPAAYSPYSDERALLALGEPIEEGSVVSIQVSAEFKVAVAGIHLEMVYDRTALRPLMPTRTFRSEALEIFCDPHREEGRLVMGMLSLEGGLVMPGKGSVVNVKFKKLREDADLSSVRIEKAILVDQESRELNTTVLGQPVASGLPQIFSLGQNHPNPFRDLTSISYTCPGDGSKGDVHVSLKVYDSSGRLVRTLLDEYKQPGQCRVEWDCRDDSGDRVGAGVYFYRIVARNVVGREEFSATKKMTVLR